MEIKNFLNLVVPESVKRTNKLSSNFLWDNSKYVFGVDKKRSERAIKCFNAFKLYHIEMGKNCTDEGYNALIAFLEKWRPENFENAKLDYKDEILDSNIVFKFEDDTDLFLHERPAIKELWMIIKSKNDSTNFSQCLITGKRGESIAKTHPSIKGVKNAKSTGANVVSFNIDTFKSYGKDQNLNAPVGEESAFAYTTALNHLLGKDSRQKIQIGDATTVFWAERQSPIEDF
ncbi:MAG: type I-C CRISPR-associated protein Cas8c/Csd1, partial [Athalassotoga sp.]|uniref:type I-C CRISPR-associated protein Cas8c/Csd1 n=1 Tax=Athalassotoga sp. TaxID=2022597 RepID=UPI003D088BD1